MNENKYPTEVEAAFLVVSDKPRDILDRIAKLSSLGRYDLRSGKTKIIRDRYFDTPEHFLQDLKLALRIREADGMRLIALKGPSRSVPGGGVERLEIEEEWSIDAFRKVLKVLKSMNIEIVSLKDAVGSKDPIVALSRYNFGIVQERETERVVKNVVHKIGDNRHVVAEMAIDMVKYLFSDIGSIVRIYEIEIEKKGDGSPFIMMELADELMGNFESEIRKWNYGKLATGNAIKQLLKEFTQPDIVDDEGNLGLKAFDLIENYLR